MASLRICPSNAALKEPIKRDEARAPQQRNFPIVGVGASAGGLQAFRQLLSNMPPTCGMAFVLVPHLAANFRSVLPELLSRFTHLPVCEARNGTLVEPGRVYVIPPGLNLAFEGGRLRLDSRDSSHRHLSVDYFFESLAQSAGERAIGVVLSGTASDGTLGLKAIKAAGGITFAQEESSAEHADMPHSAMDSGWADVVLPPEGIARELLRIAHRPPLEDDIDESESQSERGEAFSKLLALAGNVSKVDFSCYQPELLKQRIRRRMRLNKLSSLNDFLKYVQNDPAEIEQLASDLLIHVTSFFRDPQVFGALEGRVLPKLLQNREGGAPVRIWAPGCSTGEEAYSLAISIAELLREFTPAPQVMIFATDLRYAAIETARAGVYPEKIAAQISGRRIHRFFVKALGGYRVCKSIRSMCVFARHDVLHDPPFSKLDFISCRHVLGYLNSDAQQNVLRLFHFALKPGGFLVLGPAENAAGYEEQFAPIDRNYSIYVRQPGKLPLPATLLGRRPPEDHIAAANGPLRLEEQKEADRILLDRFAPPGVLVDSGLNVVQYRGHVGRYIKVPEGRPDVQLTKMIGPRLSVVLRALVAKARATGAPVVKSGVAIWPGMGNVEVEVEVEVEVIPLKGRADSESCFLILFREEVASCGVRPGDSGGKGKSGQTAQPEVAEKRIRLLTEDLRQAELSMQAVIAEQNAANEELQMANEGALSSNEELQSSMMELEIAKDKLQRLADALGARNRELNALNNDFESLLESVALPVLLVDENLLVSRFTRRAKELLNIDVRDIGRPIAGLNPTFKFPGFGEWVADVKNRLVTREQEVQDREGRWYVMQVRPYKRGNKALGGAVVTWTDITALKLSIEEISAFSKALADSARESVVILDGRLRVASANRTFYDSFRVSTQETEKRLLYELGNGQWDIPRLRALLESILSAHGTVKDYEVEHEFPHIGRRKMRLNARRIERAGESMILLAIEDVTALDQARESLRELSSRFSKVQHEERQRLARELHDTTASHMVELSMGLAQLGRETAGTLEGDSREKLARAAALAKRCSREIRTLSYLMHAPVTDGLDLSTSLRWYVEGFAERSGVSVEVLLPEQPVIAPPQISTVLFRVVQESLSNIHRHSGSAGARIALARNNGTMTVEISDSGRGMPHGVIDGAGRPGPRSGVGLMGMAERVQQAGGRLQIRSGTTGTTVRVSLPCGGAAGAAASSGA